MNIKIYCIYYKDSQIDEYNLKETNIIKLFNTSKKYKKDNINYLNKYFCELCAYYYIWKNQIKSDYIGFCHYRRNFHEIHFEYIDDKHTQCFYSSGVNEYYKPLIRQYANEKYGINNNYYNMTYKHMYIFTWNTFNKVCEFIFGFYEWINNKFNLNWKNESDIEKIITLFYNDNEYVGKFLKEWPSCIATYNEFAIAYYISQISEVKLFDETIKNIIIYHSNNKEKLYNIYKKNLKSGIRTIINISNLTNFSEEELIDNHIYDIKNYDKNNIKEYLINDYILININTTLETFINDLNKLNLNLIILNDDEYIECEPYTNIENYKIIKQ